MDPEVVSAADLIRRYLRVVGRRRPVLPVTVPGTRRIRVGGLVVDGPASWVRTWEEFLAGHTSAAGPVIPAEHMK